MSSYIATQFAALHPHKLPSLDPFTLLFCHHQRKLLSPTKVYAKRPTTFVELLA